MASLVSHTAASKKNFMLGKNMFHINNTFIKITGGEQFTAKRPKQVQEKKR